MNPDYTPTPAENWLRENWQEVERYNFEWVAVGSEGIVGHSTDFKQLMESLHPTQRDQVIYTFVNFPAEVER